MIFPKEPCFVDVAYEEEDTINAFIFGEKMEDNTFVDWEVCYDGDRIFWSVNHFLANEVWFVTYALEKLVMLVYGH